MQMSGYTYQLALRDKSFINAKLFKRESSSRKYKENQEFDMYIRNENQRGENPVSYVISPGF
jgi:hypothetical protein